MLEDDDPLLNAGIDIPVGDGFTVNLSFERTDRRSRLVLSLLSDCLAVNIHDLSARSLRKIADVCNRSADALDAQEQHS